jgi:phage portal protein BeeE
MPQLLDMVRAQVATKAGPTITLGGGQGFYQPPVWVTDALREPFWTPGTPEREQIANDFEGYITQVFKADGIVAACLFARMFAFSEVRFQWRQFNNGRPGNLFGDSGLELLEKPWRNGTTGELLARMEQDASLAGNFYATVVDDNGRYGRDARGPGRRVVRMRPDWVTIVSGSRNNSPHALDARVIFYLYRPPLADGWGGDDDAVMLLPEQVCHWSPIPDPSARWRGMSWLTPVLREIGADQAATEHKASFFRNNATLQTVVSLDTNDPDEFEQFVSKFNRTYRGARNAYKTLFVAGGADVNVVGANLRELDFKATQGAGETRIASAAGVPPVWAGFSEGLQGSSLNAGNFGQARRRFADGTIRPNWRTASAALDGPIAGPPRPGATLWYDDRDVAFLREDVHDQAEIRRLQAETIGLLVREGFTNDSVITAVQTGDWATLQHSGLYSVQLQAIQAEPTGEEKARKLAELVQKVYLGVDVVLTQDEARELVNMAGGQLSGAGPIRVAPPTSNGAGAPQEE